MKTIYLNMRTVYRVETVDQFTQGDDAPKDAKEFRKSVFWFDVMITILISFSFFYQHYKFKKTRK